MFLEHAAAEDRIVGISFQDEIRFSSENTKYRRREVRGKLMHHAAELRESRLAPLLAAAATPRWRMHKLYSTSVEVSYYDG